MQTEQGPGALPIYCGVGPPTDELRGKIATDPQFLANGKFNRDYLEQVIRQRGFTDLNALPNGSGSGAREGAFPGMPSGHTFNVLIISSGAAWAGSQPPLQTR